MLTALSRFSLFRSLLLLTALLFLAPAPRAGEVLLGVVQGTARGDSSTNGSTWTNGTQYVDPAPSNTVRIELREMVFAYSSDWQVVNQYEQPVDYWAYFTHGWTHVAAPDLYLGLLNNSTVTVTPPGPFAGTTGYGFAWPIFVWVADEQVAAWQTVDETGRHPIQYQGWHNSWFVAHGQPSFDPPIALGHYGNRWRSYQRMRVVAITSG
jgi:hypothetical protein